MVFGFASTQILSFSANTKFSNMFQYLKKQGVSKNLKIFKTLLKKFHLGSYLKSECLQTQMICIKKFKQAWAELGQAQLKQKLVFSLSFC